MAKGIKTGGRKKGVLNKISRTLKEDILEAAELAHPDGRIGYLVQQAQTNANAFLSLLGKVLPIEVTGEGGSPFTLTLKVDAVPNTDGN
jgi:hypothetical protein